MPLFKREGTASFNKEMEGNHSEVDNQSSRVARKLKEKYGARHSACQGPV